LLSDPTFVTETAACVCICAVDYPQQTTSHAPREDAITMALEGSEAWPTAETTLHPAG